MNAGLPWSSFACRRTQVGQLLDQYDLRAEKGAAANYGFLTFADEAYRSRLECKAFG